MEEINPTGCFAVYRDRDANLYFNKSNVTKVFRVPDCEYLKYRGGWKYRIYPANEAPAFYHLKISDLNILSGPTPTEADISVWEMLGYDVSEVISLIGNPSGD